MATVVMVLIELFDSFDGVETNETPRSVYASTIPVLVGGIAFVWAVLFTLVGMIANMVGMNIAIEPWVLILSLSWELFWASLWMLIGFMLASSCAALADYDDDDTSNKWFDLLIFVGGLLGAIMSVHCNIIGINWTFAWISLTFLLLNISNFCFLNLSKLSKKRYLRVQHIRLIIIFLSALLGLALGGGAGWWFKLSGIKIAW